MEPMSVFTQTMLIIGVAAWALNYFIMWKQRDELLKSCKQKDKNLKESMLLNLSFLLTRVPDEHKEEIEALKEAISE